jgi:hypothetical protein
MVMGVGALVLRFAAPVAAQQQASVRLDYERKDGASACPDAAAVASSVGERLGYEPFDAAAPDTVKVTVSKKDRGLQARIEMLGSDGKAKAERVLSSRRSDCTDLAGTMVLAIAIAIDPFRATAPPPVTADPPPRPPAEPTTIPEPPPPRETERETIPSIVVVAPPPPPPPAESPRRPIVARAAAGLVGGIGSAPVRNLGMTVGVGVGRGDLSIDLEGRADLPASVPLQVGKVSTSLLVASLVPCVHWRIVAGCGLLTGGALRAAGHGLVDSRQVTDPYLAIGARIALETKVAGKLYANAHADASAPLITTELRVGGEELWTTPPLSFLAGLGLGVAFP